MRYNHTRYMKREHFIKRRLYKHILGDMGMFHKSPPMDIKIACRKGYLNIVKWGRSHFISIDHSDFLVGKNLSHIKMSYPVSFLKNNYSKIRPLICPDNIPLLKYTGCIDVLTGPVSTYRHIEIFYNSVNWLAQNKCFTMIKYLTRYNEYRIKNTIRCMTWHPNIRVIQGYFALQG
jgi:hypothetical protein